MKLIRKIEKEGYGIEHNRYRDAMGILTDALMVYKDTPNGRVNRPFNGDIKATNYSREDNIMDSGVYDYTDEEYETMLEREVKKIP